MAAIGWYGPLIDLSSAPSHLSDFVQLLVFVHHSTPVQYKPSGGGSVIRTDIQVGDDTRPFFSVSLWGKHLSSSISAGDTVLLQNVKITKFASFVEARTVQHSSIQCLIHLYDESVVVKGIDELIESCRVGVTVREKLKKVIRWVQQHKSTLLAQLRGYHGKQAIKNWKVREEQTPCKCQMLSEVLHLRIPSQAIFRASVSEIFLPHLQHDPEERMFISSSLVNKSENIVEDLICTGCQLCGCPLGSEYEFKLKDGPFYCEKSSNHSHTLGSIYRPFMLYVWDELDYMPILVKNKAAEILFGSITAGKVQHSYNEQKGFKNPIQSFDAIADILNIPKEADRKDTRMDSPASGNRSRNLYLIWLILLRILLVKGKNSPLEFVVSVSPSIEIEEGRFEMVSMSLPISP